MIFFRPVAWSLPAAVGEMPLAPRAALRRRGNSFVNLECALDAEDLPARPPVGIGQLVSAPAASLEFLRAIRCGVVGSANNHSFDFRRWSRAYPRSNCAQMHDSSRHRPDPDSAPMYLFGGGPATSEWDFGPPPSPRAILRPAHLPGSSPRPWRAPRKRSG